MGSPLANKHVLVVEDEYFLMESLCYDLAEVGAIVVGPVPSVQKALALLAGAPRIDTAVLDVNLGGEMAYDVGDALLERSIPFIFTTGYENGILEKRFPDVKRVEKPAEFRVIAEALAGTL